MHSIEEMILALAEKQGLVMGSTNINGKGIAMLALPYEWNPAHSLNSLNKLRGQISIAAIGKDYHKRINEELQKIITACKYKFPNINMEGFADTGPLIERPLAVAAGLGFIGKNNLIHTQKYGSMVFLGYIMLDIPISQSKPVENSCDNCRRCIDACPTGALSEKGFNKSLCISYLTQKKGLLSPTEMSAIGKQLYGCDCCQLSCPHNTFFRPKFKKPEEEYPLLSDILNISKAEFEKTFRHTAAAWQGRNAIRKNAVIAIGNAKHSESIGLLERAAKDPSPLIRDTAKIILNCY